MTKIQIIIGSTRPGRNGEAVGKWVYDIAQKRDDIEVELVDIADYNLPLLDEPVPASMHMYNNEHTKNWAAKVAEADGYIFITPEYNHAPGAALKNALDYVSAEWNNKAAGFVSYGSNGGSRAVEQLRQVMAELQIADIRTQVLLYLANDFENYSVFKPRDMHATQLNALLDNLKSWAEAMKTVRNK